MSINRSTSGDIFSRSEIAWVEFNENEDTDTDIDGAGVPAGAGPGNSTLKRALEHILKGRPAGQAGQGIIWSLLAAGLAACGGGGGGGGGPVTSGGKTPDAPPAAYVPPPAAPSGGGGILTVNESSLIAGRTLLRVDFDLLTDPDGIPVDRSGFAYVWKFRDGTKIEGEGIEFRDLSSGTSCASLMMPGKKMGVRCHSIHGLRMSTMTVRSMIW